MEDWLMLWPSKSWHDLMLILIGSTLRIIDLCKEIEGGISEKTLQIAMSGVSPLDRANAVNRLVSAGKLELCKQGTQLVYRIKESGSLKGKKIK